MPGTPIDAVAENWLERLGPTAIGAPLVFWSVGLLAYAVRHGQERIVDLVTAWGLDRLDGATAAAALTIGAALVFGASSALVNWMQPAALKAIEGYWPHVLLRAAQALTDWQQKRLQARKARWQELNLKREPLTVVEADELARLDDLLTLYPEDPGRVLPTRVGNILQAAEEHPEARYGLASSVVWPHLWLLLPTSTKQEVELAQQRLATAVTHVIWSGLLLVWAGWSLWVLPIVVAALVASYLRLINAATLFGVMVRAGFDQHRFRLYEQLRWPLPRDTGQETTAGERLSEYLLRGVVQPSVIFVAPAKPGVKAALPEEGP